MFCHKTTFVRPLAPLCSSFAAAMQCDAAFLRQFCGGPALLQKNMGSRFRGYSFGPELSLLLTMEVWFRGCRVITRSRCIALLLLQITLGLYFGATFWPLATPPPPFFLFAFKTR